MTWRRIPIAAAKRIAEEYGYDQVVIVARKVGDASEGQEWMTTYGVTKVHCGVAARIGNFLRTAMLGTEAARQ